MAEFLKSRLGEFFVENTSTSDSSVSQHAWDFNTFEKNFQIIINSIDDQENVMEFDMIGTVPAFANAFRRILIAEVPTMAIDKILLYTNTSVIQDEVLAHRIGLIPIKVDPRLFEYRQDNDEEGTPEDTIEFELKIKCTKNHVQGDNSNLDAILNNRLVFSSHLKFIPRAEQQQLYGDIKPVYDDILIAKLGAGHEIDLKAHCVKGIGRDHAKFSPVCTATYRLLPEIKLLREISDSDAEKFAHCFSEGVIELVEKGGKKVAVVADARRDMGSRNVFFHEEFTNSVEMTRKKDHFIFTIESSGCLSAEDLFLESISILKEKTSYFLRELNKLEEKDMT